MRIWFITEHYFPDDYSLGRSITEIAELLAPVYSVHVITAQPSYHRGLRSPRSEVRNGVSITRTAATRFDRNRIHFRTVNMLSWLVTMTFTALLKVRRGDVVFSVVNPPLLPYVAEFASRLRGARYVLYLHDVYPEALVAAGLAKPSSFIVRTLAKRKRPLYEAASRILVLGRDMQERVWKELGRDDSKVKIIRNWGDEDVPGDLPKSDTELCKRLQLEDRFVVQYAGNIGLTHAVELLLQAAAAMQESDPSVFFLMSGVGTKQQKAADMIAAGRLENVSQLGQIPREQGMSFLSACDLSYVGYVRGMAGVSVPSRMYNVLASGRPMVAVAEAESELARLVREEQVGLVVEPDDLDGLISAIRWARANPEELVAMGKRARAAYELKYTKDHAGRAYLELAAEFATGPENQPAAAV